MNIPQGYKQTELGIIPEDWEVKRISDFTSIITGGTPSTQRPEYWGGSIMWMSSGELNKKFVFDVKGRITTEGLLNSSTRIIPPFCVLIGLAGQGKTRGTAAYNYISLCTNQSIAAILPNDKYNSLYLYYVVDSKYEYLRLLSSGDGGRGGLNKNLLNSLEISFPKTIAEQQAIAEALSDIDGLIAAVDKKIAKKRLIKQGAMQQLLTGKKRLPGFSDSWVEKKFSDLYRYASEGGTPDTNNMRFYANGDVPFVKIEDTETKYIESCNSFITSEGINNSSAWIVPVNSIIYTNGATIGNVSINKIPVATKQGILGIIPSSIINLEFMYYLLLSQNFKREVDSRQAKGTFATIILKSLDEIPIYVPLNQMEQIAIATILTDMDKEIADLEAQRDKYRLLKSGMMQKLLTGQIRLKIK
ncbi:restriction endonuclease subunit S [Barnesiella intestinihominis]|uniref:restriction endonuclease subunit S n=1 Tax=Barnesiella intestinihominis TaxID=487174 RepID=UPI00266DC11A|nr:restriction endonuclease subunit S [Barnesiella intestinihominis]